MEAKKSGGLKSRIIVGVPLAIGALATVWLGSWWFMLFVMAVAFFAVGEFCDLAKAKGANPSRVLAIACSCAFCAGANFLSYAHFAELMLVSALFAIMFQIKRGADSAVPDISATMAAMLYCGWLPAHFVVLRQAHLQPGDNFGLAIVFLAAAVCIASDAGAYFVGKAIGKHKLSSISPNKTVEGSVGGVILAVLAGWGIAALFSLPLIHCIILSLAGAVVSQIGDLFESALKRDAGVKDSGTILRGHGGVLDRFDSYLAAVPFFCIYISWFMH